MAYFEFLRSTFRVYDSPESAKFYVPNDSLVKPPEYTHVMLSGGKFYTSFLNIEMFYQLLFVFVSGSYGRWFTIAERFSKIMMRLAFDWDLKSVGGTDGIEYVRGMVQVCQTELAKAFPSEPPTRFVADIYGSRPVDVTRDGVTLTKNGYHIRFPFLNVTREMSEVIFANLVHKLGTMFPRNPPTKNTWDEAFDFSIIRNGGLRMFGADKCDRDGAERKLCSRPLEYIETSNTDGTSFRTSYLTKLKFWDMVDADVENGTQTVISMWQRSSIRLNDNDPKFASIVKHKPSSDAYWAAVKSTLMFEIPSDWIGYNVVGPMPLQFAVPTAKGVVNRRTATYTETYSAGSREFNEIATYLRTEFRDFEPAPVPPVLTRSSSIGVTSYIIKNHTCVCPYAGKVHHRNHTYFVLQEGTAGVDPYVTLLCHDDVCAESVKNKLVKALSRPLSSDMVLAFFPHRIDPLNLDVHSRTVRTAIAAKYATHRLRAILKLKKLKLKDETSVFEAAALTPSEEHFANAESAWYDGKVSEVIRHIGAFVAAVIGAPSEDDLMNIRLLVGSTKDRYGAAIDDLGARIAASRGLEYTPITRSALVRSSGPSTRS